MSGTADAALRLARRGWELLPCHSPAPAGCSCGQPECSSPGKHPRTRRGLHDASADLDVVWRWWRRWPSANVGVRTGAASGLVVVDVDPAHGGLDSLRSLDAKAKLPNGLRVRTGSGGWHLYFSHPGGTVRNSAGTTLGPGIDVRGDGGYVIAPPSRHVSGGLYAWQGRFEIPHLPGHLLERLREPETRRRPAASDPIRIDRALSAWAARALEDEARQVRTAAPGGRNHRLNRAAFNLGQIAATGLLHADEVAEHLHHAALGAGLGSREATATIRSGLRAGMQRPRLPSDARAFMAQDRVPDLSIDIGSA